MGRHAEFQIASVVPVYFCDPASPWQRGSNENTTALLRQYFPKGTDLRIHSLDHLIAVAEELNGPPAKPSSGAPPPSGSLPARSRSLTTCVASTPCIRPATPSQIRLSGLVGGGNHSNPPPRF